MEIKTIIAVIFAVSLLGMIFCKNRAGKNTIENIDELIDELPIWQKFLYGILDIYPNHMLNNEGKKWQYAVIILLLPTLISGIEIGKLVAE